VGMNKKHNQNGDASQSFHRQKAGTSTGAFEPAPCPIADLLS
jgi:hypothetical protein